MVKPTFNSKITQNDFPKAGEAFSPQFVKNHAEFVRQTYQILSGQVAFSDNFNAQVSSVTLTHGVQATIANPFSGIPTNCVVLGCSNGMSVRGNPSLISLGNGLLGVTANYDLSEQFLYVKSTISQSTTTGFDSSIVFSATPISSIGSDISFDGSSTVTFKKSGIYELKGEVQFVQNGTGSRGVWFLTGGNVRLAMLVNQAPAATDGWWGNIGCFYQASANDTMLLRAYQSSGGNLNTGVSIPVAPWMQVRKVAQDSSVSASVTLLLLNGA